MNKNIVSKNVNSDTVADLSYANTCFASLRLTVINDDEPHKVNVNEQASNIGVEMDLNQWVKETESMSLNNFSNRYFDAIVSKGEEAVPVIYKKLLEGPTHLVHALELIYPDEVKYKGFISLKQARRIWLKILQRRFQV